MNTALEQLEHWIEQYKRINGTPPINEVLTQIDLLKDYEKEQCNIDIVSYPVAQQYAEFCVRCDRENLPLIKIEDYLKQL